MKYYNRKIKKLDSELIVSSLRKAADDFDNGEIVKVRDELLDIVIAIDNYIDDRPYRQRKEVESND